MFNWIAAEKKLPILQYCSSIDDNDWKSYQVPFQAPYMYGSIFYSTVQN